MKFKRFEGSTVGDDISKVTTPASVAVGSEFVALRGGWCSSVLESFLVVMMQKVVEGLNSIAGVQVVANTILSCAMEVFENMYGGFVVLVMGGPGCRKIGMLAQGRRPVLYTGPTS